MLDTVTSNDLYSSVTLARDGAVGDGSGPDDKKGNPSVTTTKSCYFVMRSRAAV